MQASKAKEVPALGITRAELIFFIGNCGSLMHVVIRKVVKEFELGDGPAPTGKALVGVMVLFRVVWTF